MTDREALIKVLASMYIHLNGICKALKVSWNDIIKEVERQLEGNNELHN